MNTETRRLIAEAIARADRRRRARARRAVAGERAALAARGSPAP